MRREGPYSGTEPQAATTPAETAPPWTETRVVGQPLPRVDAYERVSGSAVYTLDLTLPGMLHAAVVRCPHAHARVLRVDTAKAASMPGVRAVLTADSPGAEIPWFPGATGPTSWLFDPICRHEGDEVAAVAARTRSSSIRPRRSRPARRPCTRAATASASRGRRRAATWRWGSPRPTRCSSARIARRARSTRRWRCTSRSRNGTATGSRSGTRPRACSASAPISPTRSAPRWPTCA